MSDDLFVAYRLGIVKVISHAFLRIEDISDSCFASWSTSVASAGYVTSEPRI